MRSSNPIFSMKPQTQRKQSQKNLFKIAFNPNPSLSIAFNPNPSLSISLSTLQWVTAGTEIKDPSVANLELKGSPFT